MTKATLRGATTTPQATLATPPSRTPRQATTSTTAALFGNRRFSGSAGQGRDSSPDPCTTRPASHRLIINIRRVDPAIRLGRRRMIALADSMRGASVDDPSRMDLR